MGCLGWIQLGMNMNKRKLGVADVAGEMMETRLRWYRRVEGKIMR